MDPGPPKIAELLIASVTPQNLERGALWFSENFASIKKAIQTHPWWRENAVIIEETLEQKPATLIRSLMSLGYERTNDVVGKGLFAARGGVVELWPINTDDPFFIEFHGNVIESIRLRPERKELWKPKIRAHGIDDLPAGSFVVHQDHGIGIFRGAVTRPSIDAEIITYYTIEYAAPAAGRPPDKLLVPVSEKDRVMPYVGFEMPTIHRLGGTIWITTKRKATEDARKLAHELLILYRDRRGTSRSPHAGDSELEQRFRASFSFVETEDQLKAEEEILHDLAETHTPMDRVLAGDVGFGKTEIAFRAALRVITSGRQVAILAPTTILAAQHAQSLAARVNNLPIKIQMLSRLTPKKETAHIIKDLAAGAIDCVIGTHRLLSRDIQFKNLGLLIIDEEQRFGVKQKEHFTTLRKETDVLSLSATPIPRTLHLALARLRNISIIETPPPERLAVKTLVLPYRKALIRQAIQKEIKRGGQVYFLHNRIETIGRVKDDLARLTLKEKPRIAMMHGRMREQELIRVMDSFRRHEIDILLATTIIENGLDISSANTLIVDEATRLGLAELHQLRGRIGRSDIQANAYFLFRPRRLTPRAVERLDAIQAYASLGDGYQVALRDLEIRGAGNILGREQSGAMNKVGLYLFSHMIADAVEEEELTNIMTRPLPFPGT